MLKDLKDFIQANGSLSRSRCAFIVNIPIKADETTANKLARITSACFASYQGSVPVVLLFCLNIKKGSVEENTLNTILTSCERQIETLAFPVILTKYEWDTKKYPYGEVRNALLHSPITYEFLTLFTNAGCIPYVGIGDADEGARTTPREKNIYEAVNQILQPPIDLETPDLGLMEPYLIGCGYRPYMDEVPLSQLKHEKTHSGIIECDMNARDYQSRLINPLGPYFPEPNLFISGSLLLDLRNDQTIQFGPGGGEFLQLRASVLTAMSRDIKTLDAGACHLQNNTHPVRGICILTAFCELSIETDTNRLVEGQYAQENVNKISQHHQGTSQAKTVIVGSRYKKPDDDGLFLAIRNFITKFSELDRPREAVILEIGLLISILELRRQTAMTDQDEAMLTSLCSSQEVANKAREYVTEIRRGTKKVGWENSIIPAVGPEANRTAAVLVTNESSALDVFNSVISTFSREFQDVMIEYRRVPSKLTAS